MNERELAAVLAALRYWQRTSWAEAHPEDDIATGGGRLRPLDVGEIDELCERLNAGPAPPSRKNMAAGRLYYLAFTGDYHYPRGGWKDLVGCYSTCAEAVAAAKISPSEWWQVGDGLTGATAAMPCHKRGGADCPAPGECGASSACRHPPGRERNPAGFCIHCNKPAPRPPLYCTTPDRCTYSVRVCPHCGAAFKEGSTCRFGGCPMGGDF